MFSNIVNIILLQASDIIIIIIISAMSVRYCDAISPAPRFSYILFVFLCADDITVMSKDPLEASQKLENHLNKIEE